MKEILLATIPATIPTLAVLVGILLNQSGITRLDSRITSLEARLDGRINTLDGRISALESRVGGSITSLNSRFDALSKQLNDGIVMLVGRDTDKSERLARLEERSKG
jgi:hypothetical protein